MEITATGFTVTCAILCAVLSIALRYMGQRNLRKLASQFDGPLLLPILGNSYLFTGDPEAQLIKMRELVNTYSSPFRLWFGPRLYVCVTDAEQAKTILLSPKAVEKGYIYTFLQPFIGLGLVTAPAQKWRLHRRLIQPTFSSKILNPFVEVFAAQAKIFVDKIEQNLDGPEFEVFDLSGLALLDMLCETVLGVKIGAQMNSEMDYVHALQKVGGSICHRMVRIWLHPDFIFDRTTLGKNQKQVVKIIRDFTSKVIQKKEVEFLKRDGNQPAEHHSSDDDGCEPKTRREVFLDSLMKLSRGSNKLSDQDLRDEVDTMTIAGHDTTASAYSFLMLMLASHPDVQDKVYEEIFEIYGYVDIEERPVIQEDLAQMIYLERVIKETIRLFPVFPFFARAITEDLNVDGYIFPKGCEALIPVLEVQRSEKYWPNPLKFDPDRFLPEEVAKRHPYSYLAFSAGPRNCIGFRYAIMAMKTLAVTMLRRYTLKKDNIVPVKDIRLRLETTIKTIHPITVRIEKRIRD